MLEYGEALDQVFDFYQNLNPLDEPFTLGAWARRRHNVIEEIVHSSNLGRYVDVEVELLFLAAADVAQLARFKKYGWKADD